LILYDTIIKAVFDVLLVNYSLVTIDTILL